MKYTSAFLARLVPLVLSPLVVCSLSFPPRHLFFFLSETAQASSTHSRWWSELDINCSGLFQDRPRSKRISLRQSSRRCPGTKIRNGDGLASRPGWIGSGLRVAAEGRVGPLARYLAGVVHLVGLHRNQVNPLLLIGLIWPVAKCVEDARPAVMPCVLRSQTNSPCNAQI